MQHTIKPVNYRLRIATTILNDIKEVKGFKTNTQCVQYAVNNIVKLEQENKYLKRLLKINCTQTD